MSAPDPLDQLRKLAALRAEGVIDDEEFSRLKAEFLARAVAVIDAAPQTADDTTPRPLDAWPPMDGELPQQLTAVRVTEPEVAQSKHRIEALESTLAQGSEAHQAQLRRGHCLQRTIWHFRFLQRARALFRDFAWGRMAPVMVITALGFLTGVVLFGVLPLSTGLVFIGGILIAGAALLGSLHLFLLPRDEVVAERIAASQQELAQIESQIPRTEAELAAAKQSLEAATQQYREMVERFESRRNQMLLFDWRTLRGGPFEKFLRAIFEELGYQVQLTRSTGDQGVDLIVVKNNVRIAVQAKGYADSVGNAAVQQAHAGMTYYHCSRCAVITNSFFTPSAIELAARVGCVLVDGSRIPALILGEVPLE